MKKTMIMASALCMLGQTSSAQVIMYDNIVTVEYKDAEGKIQTLEESSYQNKVEFKFLGSKKKVEVGEPGEDFYHSAEEENANAYVYESNHTDNPARWNSLRLYALADERGDKWGVYLSTSPEAAAPDSTIYLDPHDTVAQIDLNNLKYHTTYYVRPFVMFKNGVTMYGSEKAFTTPYTFGGVVRNEPEGQEWHGVYGDVYGDVFLNKKALSALVDEAYADDEDVQQTIIGEVGKRMTSELIGALIKQAYKKIECVYGTMYFVDQLPDEFVKSFREECNPYSMEPIEFCTDYSSVNLDMDGKGATEFTKSAITPMWSYECPESWGVPGNRFMDIEPISDNANPIVAFNIPQYLWGREYSIYAVFVRIGALGELGIKDYSGEFYHKEYDPEDLRPYKFYVNMYERNSKGTYPISGKRMKNPNVDAVDLEGKSLYNTNYFVTNTENRVDTLYIGDYTFSTKPGGMIQIQSQISSRQVIDYSREILISKFILVPKAKEE